MKIQEINTSQVSKGRGFGTRRRARGVAMELMPEGENKDGRSAKQGGGS